TRFGTRPRPFAPTKWRTMLRPLPGSTPVAFRTATPRRLITLRVFDERSCFRRTRPSGRIVDYRVELRKQLATPLGQRVERPPPVFLPRLEQRELPFYKALDAGTVSEERRLFYVGLTRAKKHL